MIQVLVNSEGGGPCSEETLIAAVRQIMRDHGVRRGEVSVAIVDDPTMQRLNRQHLDHDYPTDVLSFQLERYGEFLEGEIVVSADTARRSAGEYGWSTPAELLLYVVHGALHLVGYDDHTDRDRDDMRSQEAKYLRLAGLELPTAAKEPST